MKKLLVSLAVALISVFALTLTACGGKTLDKLQLDNILAEGTFEQGVTLAANLLEKTDEKFTSALEKLAEEAYDEEKLAVYDISLVKDNAKVQPDGSVKITMPAPFESETGYVTYHISGEKVEELVTAYADGKISFETGGFSYFAVSAKVVTDITALELDGANFGFKSDGVTEYIIGSDATLDPQNVLVKGITADGKKDLEKGVDYIIDLGGLNPEVEGTYTITYALKADKSVKATFVVKVIDANKVTALKLDGANFGFAYNEDGTIADKTEYVIGSGATLDPQNVLVYGITAGGVKKLEKGVDYTIDVGGLNPDEAGTYTITYTLKTDTSVKATLIVEVVAE